MATVVGGIGTTHVPSIGRAIADGKQRSLLPFFRGFDYVHYWLARTKPDIAIVFYNDHGSTSSSTSCRPSRSAPRPNIAAKTRDGAFQYRGRLRVSLIYPGI
jgi:hypothetical protein